MKTVFKTFLPAIFALSISLFADSNNCKTFSINPNRLAALHKMYLKNKLGDNEAFKNLISRADNYLDMKPVSVMDKSQTPPGGDKHDYMSMAPYWWPNPNTADGLPYIRKDGERNPEIYEISDHSSEGKMTAAVESLSLAYYITKGIKYSKKAVQLLCVWFLDKDTRMNPNLKYAQAIRGICTGRGIGIIETASMYKIVDAIGMLETSKEWTKRDDMEIRKWFDEYLNWLRTNRYGKDESNKKNNHGTWYDVQVVSISLFLGKDDLARKVLNEANTKRIALQIEADGKQPLELERTKSWSYSVFNLTALLHLAYLGDNVRTNLWDYKNPKGGSIRKALSYVLPYSLNMAEWKNKQIQKIDVNSLYPLLLLAEKKYDRKIYSGWTKKIFNKKADSQPANLSY